MRRVPAITLKAFLPALLVLRVVDLAQKEKLQGFRNDLSRCIWLGRVTVRAVQGASGAASSRVPSTDILSLDQKAALDPQVPCKSKPQLGPGAQDVIVRVLATEKFQFPPTPAGLESRLTAASAPRLGLQVVAAVADFGSYYVLLRGNAAELTEEILGRFPHSDVCIMASDVEHHCAFRIQKGYTLISFQLAITHFNDALPDIAKHPIDRVLAVVRSETPCDLRIGDKLWWMVIKLRNHVALTLQQVGRINNFRKATAYLRQVDLTTWWASGSEYMKAMWSQADAALEMEQDSGAPVETVVELRCTACAASRETYWLQQSNGTFQRCVKCNAWQK